MTKVIGWAAGALFMVFVIIVGVPLLLLAGRPATARCNPSSTGAGLGDAAAGQLSAEQEANAEIIVAVTHQLGLSDRAAVIAVATALQESGLRNLGHGDAAGPDSRGLFQQRLQFFTDVDVMNPADATRAFLVRLIRVPGWDTIPLADAAQAVQRSAFPALYAGREPEAQAIVDRLWGSATTAVACVARGTGPVFLFGDSIMVGADAELRKALTGREITIDAAVGRRLDEGVPIIAAAHDETSGNAVVIGLCTNFGGTEAQFSAMIDTVMTTTLASVVVWTTCTEWSPAQAAANAVIRQAASRFQNLRVAEWAAPSLTTGYLGPDGIHPTPAGSRAFAAVIAQALPAQSASVVDGYTLPLDVSWYERHPEWFNRPHHDYPAADISVPAGTVVFAATAGTVVSAPTGGSCGDGVIIDADDGARYTYCHGTVPTVPPGVHVEAGDPIMISGFSGAVVPEGPAGAHLHFQIQLDHGAGPLVCPQAALQAWASGQVLDVRTLPTTGCFN